MTEILSETANATIEIPANVMGLLRESYSRREKTLDWILAFAVVATMVYIFKDQLLGMVKPIPQIAGCPNSSDAPDIAPSIQFDTIGNYLTYNMPMARRLPNRHGPHSNRVPVNPAYGPFFAPLDTETVVNHGD